MRRAVASPVRQLDIEPPYLVVVPGMTEKDFCRLADEDSNWEYLDGRIVMHSPASGRHEDLFRFLLTLLSDYLGERGGALVPFWGACNRRLAAVRCAASRPFLGARIKGGSRRLSSQCFSFSTSSFSSGTALNRSATRP
jgi:hypothetical protein